MNKCNLTAMIVWSAAALVLLVCPQARAEEPEALAERILQAVDRPVGLAHLPHCGAGELALALAEADEGLYVHGQDPDPSAVAAARKAADERGFLNRRASFDQGGVTRLLPVGRSCDLIVLTDLKRDELTQALAAEIRRVLHPWYGVAVLGDVSGKLDTSRLKGWAQKIAPDVSELPGAGNLVIAEAGPLEGADNWSHWWHGPDNNAVSTDTAYSYPETVQWTGKPYDATRIDLPIVANGRLFMLWNGHLLDVTFGEAVLPGEEVMLKRRGWQTVMEAPLEEQRGPLLVARATGSGVRLWHRRMSPAMWLQTARSVVVADGDRLLVADGSTLLVLDQATGEELRRVEMDCGEIKWIAATDRYVAVLGGPQHSRFPERMRRMSENVTPFRSSGQLLTVLERKSLRTLWTEKREEEGVAFDPRTPAIAGGRLFVCTEDGRAEAYRMGDGKLQWRTSTGITHGKEVGYLWDRVSRHPVAGYAVAGLCFVGAPEMDRCAVLSQEDGHPVWDIPRGGGPTAPIPLAFDGLVWFGGTGLDPATGEQERKVPAGVGGCGHLTAAPQGIVGQRGLTWDATAEREVPGIPAKSACGPSQFVANGLIWRFPNGVWHVSEWRGFNVRGPVEEDLPSADFRLARTVEPDEPNQEVQGWAAYRANRVRSASVSAEVGDDADLIWRVSVAHETVQDAPAGGVLLGARIMPAPPVTAGHKVVIAGNDGAIEALDLRTGKQFWRARTGGRIQSSPTIWKGRVYVGSADGCVYAFALEDGKQLWRLRVAPEAGRMMLYGQLGSRWPVLGSPMVADGRVFAVAGFMDCLDGVRAVAADAVSGEILWERTEWKDADGETLSPGRLAGGTGQFCWDDEVKEAVYSAGEGLPVRLTPKDGTLRAAYARGRVAELSSEGREVAKAFRRTHYAVGQDVGKFGRGWMVLGGSRMLMDRPARDLYHRQKKDVFLSQEGSGDGRLPVLQVNDCILVPCWDDADVLLTLETGKNRFSIALAPKADLTAFLNARMAGKGEGIEWIGRAVMISEHQDELLSWSVEQPYAVSPLGCALTDNAALVLTLHGKAEEPKLIALDRADGKELWHVELPAVPVYNGLAVAAPGRVIVALRDGTVLCIGQKEESAQ